MIVPDGLAPWLGQAMDLSYQRQTLLSSNIANVDTPGYRPTDLHFEDFLVSQLQNDGAKASSFVPNPQFRYQTSPGVDGNRVDIEVEAVRMSENKMFYELASEVSRRRYDMLRFAITEGGR